MAKKTKAEDQAQAKVSMSVRYDSMETQFASQFIVNSTLEEIIVNFSPGAIADPQTNQQTLPINTRIAMTPQGAARLAQTLSNVLANMQRAAKKDKPAQKVDTGSLN